MTGRNESWFHGSTFGEVMEAGTPNQAPTLGEAGVVTPGAPTQDKGSRGGQGLVVHLWLSWALTGHPSASCSHPRSSSLLLHAFGFSILAPRLSFIVFVKREEFFFFKKSNKCLCLTPGMFSDIIIALRRTWKNAKLEVTWRLIKNKIGKYAKAQEMAHTRKNLFIATKEIYSEVQSN